jgi:ribosomal protein S18 acetylase RimI-like enzyme
VEIERASIADCRAIAEVHVQSSRHAYRDLLPAEYLASLSVNERQAMWLRVVETQPSHLIVARDAGLVVGFSSFGASRDEGAPKDCGEVWAIYLAPSCWSVGAGRRLWLASLQQLLAEGFKTVSLWVIAGNERAIRFYLAAGFKPEPGSAKQVTLGGATLEEVRYVYGTAG